MMPALDPYLATLMREPETVAGSLVIAIMATFIAFEFAGRLRQSKDLVATRMWMAAGSITLGSGIWAMHFVGMSAATYPFAARYDESVTALSWLVTIAIAGIILATARIRQPGFGTLLGVSAVGAVSVTGMHLIGLYAMHVSPAPTLRWEWAALGVVTAAIGFGAGLAVFFGPHARDGRRRARWQLLASTIFGGALAGMHYLLMAATAFADGAICKTRNGLDVDGLGNALELATVMGLALVYVVTMLERRATDHAGRARDALHVVREKLNFVTFNDVATGLPNRLVFDDRLQQAAARSERSGESIAILFIGCEAANGIGMPAEAQGVESLRRIAESLSDAARAADTVASIGAGHFLVMVAGAEPAEVALQIAERLKTRIAALSFDPQGVPHGVGVGIAVYPRDGGIAEIVRNANAAFVATQRDGGHGVRFFEPAEDAEARVRSALLVDLREAIRNDELELHYQPKVFAGSSEIEGVEALLRWNHPVQGVISPVVFVPLAERHGLIDEIGAWVVRAACRQMRDWRSRGLTVRVAVNVSPRQLSRPELAEEILQALADASIDPSQLTCEVTESGVMNDPVVSAGVFDRLCAAGVGIAIDDFGTGYSSLSQLRRLPVDQLKIDRSFVNDLEHSDDARAIVRAIVQMAHTLRLEVVAEGVETEGQQRILLDCGCDKLQGYLFARPMTAARLTAQLGDWTRPGLDQADLKVA